MVNPVLRSMTGYATHNGQLRSWSWVWEFRSVNARGLDIKLRVPDWITGLEPEARKLITSAVDRGNVTANLRMSRSGEATGVVNETALAELLKSLSHISNAATAVGVSLAAPTALDIMAARGIGDADQSDPDEIAQLRAAVITDLDQAVRAFLESRAEEGLALKSVLEQQLTRLAELTDSAAQLAKARTEVGADRFKAQVSALLEATGDSAPDRQRLAQEIAILAVKGDVTEEIDRLRAHIGSAKDLLIKAGPVGRRLDFLCQEFNREANTLCSKSQDTDLTATGLEIKVIIDQMREQVQNLE